MSPVQQFTFKLMRAAGPEVTERTLAAMRQDPRRDLPFLLIRAAVTFAADSRYDLENGVYRK